MPWLIQKVQQGQAVETDPEFMWLTGQTEGQEGGIYQQLEYARQMKDKRCQILVPVHSVGLFRRRALEPALPEQTAQQGGAPAFHLPVL